jgi:hypothetical protein
MAATQARPGWSDEQAEYLLVWMWQSIFMAWFAGRRPSCRHGSK